MMKVNRGGCNPTWALRNERLDSFEVKLYFDAERFCEIGVLLPCIRRDEGGKVS